MTLDYFTHGLASQLVVGLVTVSSLAAAAPGIGEAAEGTTASIQRHYAYAGERRIHYRRAGEGAPLVMLHASPGSSAGIESLIADLADHYSVIAIDSPGYGESASLGMDQPDMGDYADALVVTLDALNLDVVHLYGTHTGGKIGLEFGVRYPERVTGVFLDGIGLYTPEERASRIAHYTPSLQPQWDGGHLVRTWAMRREMLIFSPWYDRNGEARMARDLRSPQGLHDMAVDFLRAGEGYWRGYQAAFRYDAPAALKRVQVPTLLGGTPGDSLRKHLGRVDKVSPQVRIEAVDELVPRIVDFFAPMSLANAPPPPPVTRTAKLVRRDYLNTSVGQVLVRKAGPEGGRPVVLLHASPASSRGLEPLLLELGSDRPAFTFDSPGNGDSAPLPGTPEIQDIARVIGEAIDGLGLEEYDLYGTQTGALIAMEVAIAHKEAVRHLILDGLPMFSEAQSQEYLTHYVQPIKISWDGTQLLWAWNFLRDGSLWWPWYNRTAAGTRVGVGVASPEVLHRHFVEFIKGGTTYHLNYRAAFAYRTRERLPLLEMPVLLCAAESDLLTDGLTEAKELTANAVVQITPGRETAEKAAATTNLYRRFLADRQ
jgi:pimeloyl-ACP methyl ester carboxylesterase